MTVKELIMNLLDYDMNKQVYLSRLNPSVDYSQATLVRSQQIVPKDDKHIVVVIEGVTGQ